jgi:REP element-mobilizing transposase RayT
MARPLRIQFPGALYHVTSRGNGRADIFLDDGDRQAFLNALATVCERLRWRCYAYCLMTNHYHLVLETPEGNLAQGMRQLNGVYTQRFNRQHGHVGHVLQGRYKAILVEREAYLLELTRYVVLNPVRAGMVAAPEQWPWSSYRALMSREPAPPWLARDQILGHFARAGDEARPRYVRFVRDGLRQPSIWGGLRHQMYLGSEEFVHRLQGQLQAPEQLEEIPKVQRKPSPPTLQALVETYDDQWTAMAAAYASGAHTLKAIAAHFGVHYSTVSRAVKRVQGREPTAKDGVHRRPDPGASARELL